MQVRFIGIIHVAGTSYWNIYDCRHVLLYHPCYRYAIQEYFLMQVRFIGNILVPGTSYWSIS